MKTTPPKATANRPATIVSCYKGNKSVIMTSFLSQKIAVNVKMIIFAAAKATLAQLVEQRIRNA